MVARLTTTIGSADYVLGRLVHAPAPGPGPSRLIERPRDGMRVRRPSPVRTRGMADLKDGESVEVKGSGARPYVLRNVGGVYSCSCPAWRNQSVPIERRTCKHLRKLRGDEAERVRVGQPPAATARTGGGRARRGRPAAAAGRAVGQRPGPGRLVAQREARRRPRLLGRPGADLAPGQPVPRPRLVHSPGCRTSRSTASCGSAARRSSAPSASSGGRTRATCGRR